MNLDPTRYAGLFSHLEELRKRIVYSLIALVVGAAIAYFFSDRIVALLTRSVDKLVFLSPTEAFVVQLKAALVVGGLLAAPVIFYQLWRFVRPALRANEARPLTWAVFFSTVFFLGGAAFAYFIMIPWAMKFLLGFGSGKVEPMLSLERYVTAVAEFMLAAGTVFEMPVVIFFLSLLGLVRPKTLWKHQRIAIVIIFIVAAILSPPDIFSQILMAIPMLVLYELSILASFLATRRRRAAVSGEQASA
jgi:sec-independent protein translocase protein TatC